MLENQHPNYYYDDDNYLRLFAKALIIYLAPEKTTVLFIWAKTVRGLCRRLAGGKVKLNSCGRRAVACIKCKHGCRS